MKAKRWFGQNFLRDQGVVRAIVRCINPSLTQTFVEIGPGQGALTGLLLEQAGRLAAIEIDEDLRLMIYDGLSEQLILNTARQRYPGIEADGRRRVLAGDTSIEEVLRVTAIA